MKKKIICSLLCLVIYSLFFGFTLSSCKKKGQKEAEENVEILELKAKENHTWYYFTPDGFAETDSIKNTPLAKKQPYTEAIRISSANNAAGTASDSGNKAYALVNRLGLLCFENDKISIAKDISVFADRSADNLVFMNDTPVFSVYKSSIFNSSTSTETRQDDSLFLLQFDDSAKISYPIINSSNLTKEKGWQVTDFIWDGKEWFCSLKNSESGQEKIDFTYIKFSPAAPLLSITPVNAGSQLLINEASAQEFRDAMKIKDYSLAPQRIRNMLDNFSASIPFILEVKAAGGTSSVLYENQPSGVIEEELNAKAIISQSWSAVLFEDGTLFIEGALPGKHILRAGKPVAVRLPKLEQGYVYSDFVISGTNLYAAWEETDFYQVLNSGFLRVDLDSTLYSIIK